MPASHACILTLPSPSRDIKFGLRTDICTIVLSVVSYFCDKMWGRKKIIAHRSFKSNGAGVRTKRIKTNNLCSVCCLVWFACTVLSMEQANVVLVFSHCLLNPNDKSQEHAFLSLRLSQATEISFFVHKQFCAQFWPNRMRRVVSADDQKTGHNDVQAVSPLHWIWYFVLGNGQYPIIYTDCFCCMTLQVSQG